ncbi:Ig-like domain-containing protein [Candidatus Bipolaricaulota bacterium]
MLRIPGRAISVFLFTLTLCLMMTAAGVSQGSSYPNCGFNCSAKDVTIVEAFVNAPAICTPGEPLSATIFAAFDNGTNSNRYAVRIIGDVYVNGNRDTSIDVCAVDTLGPGTNTLPLTNVSWNCGELVEVRIVTVSWASSPETCGDEPSCAGRKAKCWFTPAIVIGGLPLSVDFSSSSPECDGSVVSFSDQTSGGDAPYGYSWDFGDGGTATSANPSHLYSAPGTYTVTLTVTSGSATSSSTKTVLVRPNPDSSAANTGPYCAGDTIQLSASGGVTYSWTGPNGFASTDQNPTIADAASVNAGVYTVTATNIYGCTDQATTLVEVDATAPILSLPPDITVECGASTDPAATGLATASDDTDPSPVVSYSDLMDSSGCGNTGTITRMLTATDTCGNASTGSQTITLVDTTLPVLQVSSVSFECDGAGNAADISNWLSSAVATDTCGAVTLSNDYSGLIETCPGVGTASVMFTATDACGNTAQRMVTLTTVDTTPPLVQDDSATLDEDTTVLVDVLLNDSDLCDATVSIASVSSPASGGMSIVGDQVLYTPAANFNGTDSFSYLAEDCSGNTASATVTLAVGPVNDPPVANNELASTFEDTPIAITVTGTDLDGDVLTYVIRTLPSNGTITGFDPATGQLTYTPDADYNGPDSFTFEVCDPSDACDTGTVTIGVAPADDPPTADPQSATTPEDTPLPITLTGGDIDGDPIRFTIISQPSNGSITGLDLDTGELFYTPDADYNGPDSFVFAVCDPHPEHGCAQATVTITVTPDNDPPVANDDSTSTLEDVSVIIGVGGNDSDVDGNLNALSVSIASSPSSGTASVDSLTGDVTYVPGLNFNGLDSFTYQICDTDGLCDTATVTVNVVADGDPPIAEDDTASTPEDQSVLIDVLTNDSDVEGNLDPTSVSILTPPVNGTVSVDVVTGEVTYAPNPNYAGEDVFTYQVCDADNVCDSAAVSVTVVPVNDPPVANNELASTFEDTPIAITVTGTDLDGDVLTYVIRTLPSNGTITGLDPATGQLTYTPDLNYNGPDSFTFDVCDPSGACDTGTVTIGVDPVDDPPTADPQSATTPEDTPLPITLTGGDIDGDPIRFTIISQPSNGSVTGLDLNTGELLYTPDADYNGPDSFVFAVCDPHPEHGCAQETVTIRVTPVNDPPVANDDDSSVAEDGSVVIDVAANDSDLDGDLDLTSVSIISEPPHGAAEVDPVTGAVTYEPDPNFNGEDTFTYQICDSAGVCDTATVTVTVSPQDDPPVASDDTANVAEDGAVTILVPDNDTDPDGDLDLTSVLITGEPTNGTVSVNPVTGAISYEPDPDYNGPDSFTYEICDLAGFCDTAAVTINVTPVADPPVANDDTANVAEDGAVTIPVLNNDTDPDGDLDPTSVSIVSQPANGTVRVDPVTGAISYEPDPNFNGEDTFSYQICDSLGVCDTATVTVTVVPQGDPPVAEDDAVEVAEDGVVAIDVVANDSDPDGDLDPTTVSIIGESANGTVSVDPVTGAISYEPDPDFNGTDTFTYQVCDTDGVCDTATVTVEVDPVDDPPVAGDDTTTVPEDGSVVIPVAGNDTDPDGDLDVTSVTVIGQPPNGTVTVNPVTGAITYEPDADFNGEDTLTYQICDSLGVCDTATVTVDVTPVDDPPVANDDSTTTPEDTAVVVGVVANDFDIDGNLDRTTVTLLDSPANGTVSVNGFTGEVTYTPEPDFNGTNTFSYRVCDTDGLCDTATVTVNVGPEDDPPVALNDSGTVLEDGVTTIDVVANDGDPDGNLDPTTVVIVSPPAHGTTSVDPVTGAISYEPNANYNGPDTLTYEICDTDGACDLAVVSIDVIPVDDPPVANDDTSSVAEDASVVIDVVANDTDVDGDLDPTSVGILTQPSNGIVSVNPVTGAISYEPAPNFNGQDTFTYQVCDSVGVCDTAMVTVNVAPVDDLPVATPQDLTTPEDTALAIGLIGSDADGDPVTYVILVGPTHGTISGFDAITGELIYTPNPDYNGPDSFTFEVCDPHPNECGTATVTINVTPVADPPVANDDTANVAEDGAVTIPVLNNDTDPDGDLDPTSVSIVSQPANGTVRVDPVTGAISYEPDPNFNGEDTFSYQICDSLGVCDTATVTVDILPVDDPPLAVDDAATTPEDVSVTIPVTLNDIDVDGEIDPETVVILTPPPNGTAAVDPTTGEIDYLPNPDFNGQDSLTYRVCNLEGVCDIAQVRIDVTSENDPPEAACFDTVVVDGTLIRIELQSSDADGDAVSYRIVDAPNQGTIGGFDSEQGSFFYSPLACAEVEVAVFVGAGAPPGVASVLPGETLEIQMAGGNLALAEIFVSPEHGEAAVDQLSGTFLYTPDEGYTGSDSFSYLACPSTDEGFSGPVNIVYEVIDSSGATDQCVVQLFVIAAAGGGGFGECGQKVVISEVAWAGTRANEAHEWIELRNLEDEPVDLSGWTLRWRLRHPESEEDELWKVIPLSGVMAAYQPDGTMEFVSNADGSQTWWMNWPDERRDDMFLIERLTDDVLLPVGADLVYDDRLPLERFADLDDRGEFIELVDPTGCVVDTANIGRLDERTGWAAGEASLTATMERTDIFETDIDENWHTNLGIVRNGFDAFGNLISGTPRQPNSPLLAGIADASIYAPLLHPMGESILLAFDNSTLWPADLALWHVVVTRDVSDEIFGIEWDVVSQEDGSTLITLQSNQLPLNVPISIWVRTPTGGVLFAPYLLYPY